MANNILDEMLSEEAMGKYHQGMNVQEIISYERSLGRRLINISMIFTDDLGSTKTVEIKETKPRKVKDKAQQDKQYTRDEEVDIQEQSSRDSLSPRALKCKEYWENFVPDEIDLEEMLRNQCVSDDEVDVNSRHTYLTTTDVLRFLIDNGAMKDGKFTANFYERVTKELLSNLEDNSPDMQRIRSKTREIWNNSMRILRKVDLITPRGVAQIIKFGIGMEPAKLSITFVDEFGNETIMRSKPTEEA